MRLVLLVAALCLVGLPNALAQSDDWFVLPTTSDNEVAWMQPTVNRVSRELRRQGIGVWSSAQAIRSFEQRGSAAPTVLAESVIKTWTGLSEAAVRELAKGEYATALAQLEEAEALSNTALEELNREPKRARMVLDTCLYMVRALLETGDRDAAEDQAANCVRMVPGGEPARYMHPPTVAILYEEAKEPAPTHANSLLVESDPPGCELRINGVSVGHTPFEMNDLYPGDYRAQVECEAGVGSRVHRVSVSRGRTSLFVFVRFDQAVRAEPILHLHYDESRDEDQRDRDAREFARTLPAGAVVVASRPTVDSLELRLFRGTRKESALARVTSTPDGPSNAEVVEATATLIAGECKDLTGADPVALDCETGQAITVLSFDPSEDRISGSRPPRGQFISGLTLASVGAASLLTGYGLVLARSAAGDDWIAEPGSLGAHQTWLNMGSGIITTGVVGAATLVTAMPLVLPYKHKTPWWAWLSGGLGVGFTVGAIAAGVTADPRQATSCSVNNLSPQPCVSRAKRTDLALMLGATAAPLLTMPLVYLFRKDEKKLAAELSPGITVNRTGGAFGIRGVF